MRHAAFPFVLFSCLAACSSAPGDQSEDQAATGGTLSYVGQSVLDALQAKHPATRGKTWDMTLDNALDHGWVLQTPLAEYWGQSAASLPIAADCNDDPTCDPDFHLFTCNSQDDCTQGGICRAVPSTVSAPGDAPSSLCTGHSDAMYDAFYGLVTKAQKFVDVTSLSPPDGRFEAALRNAITFLGRSGRHVQVRVLYGEIIGGEITGQEVSATKLLASLTRDLDPAGTVKVTVGSYRDGLSSWDHAKIVSVDGAEAIVGGHNMWTKHYLDKNPVHDISMRVRGGAAAHASHFASQVWDFTCHPSGLFASADVQSFPAGTNGCDVTFDLPPVARAGRTPVFAVGRLGAIGDEASDDAVLAMVNAAKTRVRLSLQDLGPPGALGVRLGGWPEGYMSAIVGAIGRGADVYLILTNKGAVPGGLHAGSATYSNGFTPEDAAKKILATAQKHPELLGGDARAALCAKLHVASLRAGPDDAWPDGSVLANHAKLAMVDDRAFYIGSQNWYAANLAEFGYIVDDAVAAKELAAEYYDRAWESSRRVAVSGSDAPGCSL